MVNEKLCKKNNLFFFIEPCTKKIGYNKNFHIKSILKIANDKLAPHNLIHT